MYISESPHLITGFLQQKVNSFLGIALISLMTFWVVLYYLSAQAEIIGHVWVGSGVSNGFSYIKQNQFLFFLRG
jgi:hypothetical protein